MTRRVSPSWLRAHPRSRAWCSAVAAVLLHACALALRAAEVPPITSIATLRNLAPPDAARALPVRVSGVITRCTRDEVYLQDGNDAVFVRPNHQRPLYQPGDYVEVSGTTAEGQFAPIIEESASRLIDHVPLPAPVLATYGDLAAGRLDCRWVEVVGTIRSAEPSSGGTTRCRLALDGVALRLEIADLPTHSPTPLVGATVRVRGVVGGLKNNVRQLVEPGVWVKATSETFALLSSGPADLFASAAQPIATLMSYPDAARANALSKIEGQVLWAESPTRIFVRDDSDSLDVHLQRPVTVQIGDRVEAVGFAEHGTLKPLLADAYARRLGSGPRPAPRRTTVRRLLRHSDESDLVQIEAVVQNVAHASQWIIFTLAEDGATFDAIYARKSDEEVRALPGIGSRVSAVGICKIERITSDLSQLASPVAFSLRLRTLEDLRVITAPAWWTVRRLGLVVSGLIAILLLAAAWIVSLRRTVARQTEVIVRKTRTEATLEERDRIARELHDSFEQRLAGSTILLDAAAHSLEDRSHPARAPLDTARAMLRHSLDEVQRAVLNLRARELETGDFATALEHSLRALVGHHGVTLTFERQGGPIQLDGVAENHVLRVAQEAVTNALKHARATAIAVLLQASATAVVLRVTDNGRGMTSGSADDAASAGQFGLIGMRERADKLQGELTIVSEPDRGVAITLMLPHTRVSPRTATSVPTAPPCPR